jgi:hypothetical protein
MNRELQQLLSAESGGINAKLKAQENDKKHQKGLEKG